MLKNALSIFGITVLILMFFLPSYTKLQELKEKNADYERRMLIMRDEMVKLKEEKLLLEENPDYLEKVARDKMGLVRKGEVIYRLVPVNAEINKKR